MFIVLHITVPWRGKYLLNEFWCINYSIICLVFRQLIPLYFVPTIINNIFQFITNNIINYSFFS